MKKVMGVASLCSKPQPAGYTLYTVYIYSIETHTMSRPCLFAIANTSMVTVKGRSEEQTELTF